jgi:hypothetical protein
VRPLLHEQIFYLVEVRPGAVVFSSKAGCVVQVSFKFCEDEYNIENLNINREYSYYWQQLKKYAEVVRIIDKTYWIRRKK